MRIMNFYTLAIIVLLLIKIYTCEECTESEAPTSEAPTSEVPPSEAPKSEVPASEVPTSEVPTSEVPTSTDDCPESDIPTSNSDSPTSDSPTSNDDCRSSYTPAPDNQYQIFPEGETCMPAKKGEPIVMNYQSVEDQNVADQCLEIFHGDVECSSENEYREIDGSCSNFSNKYYGMFTSPILRLQPALYADGKWAVRTDLPSARVISNNFVTDQPFKSTRYTVGFMQIAQILAHDVLRLRLSDKAKANECCDNGTRRIPENKWPPGCLAYNIPTNDKFYQQFGIICDQIFRGAITDDFQCPLEPSQQVNDATPHLDGSVIYGFTKDVASNLRLKEFGKLKYEEIDGSIYLPRMTEKNAFCFAEERNEQCRRSSDFRANQHLQIAVLQTVLLRVHNLLCDEYIILNPNADDEEIYQKIRQVMTGILQNIIFGRFAEILLGPECAAQYGLIEDSDGYTTGFDDSLNPAEIAESEHAALRSLHSIVDEYVILYDEDRNEFDRFPFSNWFNNPSLVVDPNIFNSILIGFATQPMAGMDRFYSAGLTRENLKRPDEKFGSDLAAIDILRDRDCGIQSYPRFATLGGYPLAKTFEDLLDRMPQDMANRLKITYNSVENVDALIGGLLEPRFGESLTGRTFHAILAEHLRRCKYSDGYFFSRERNGAFTIDQLNTIRSSSFAFLLCYGSDKIQRMQWDAFVVPGENDNPLDSCENIVEDFLKKFRNNWKN